jgi:hypothetical protein
MSLSCDIAGFCVSNLLFGMFSVNLYKRHYFETHTGISMTKDGV